MKSHQGYLTRADVGAQCSGCDEWIPPGESAVLMQPVKITDGGSTRPTATAIHGVLCEACYSDAEVIVHGG